MYQQFRFLKKMSLPSPFTIIIIRQWVDKMLQKYTKYCSSDTLIKYINAEIKDEQALHVLLAVFKKPLSWVQEKYDHEGMYDAISRMSIRKGVVSEQLEWVYVIQGKFLYHEMPFQMSEFIRLTDNQSDHTQGNSKTVIAVLTKEDIHVLNHKKEEREKEKIIKFFKTNLFYPYYLEEEFVKEFAMLTRVKKLGFNKCLNWKDEDGSHKIGIVYKGVVSIEYPWKRNVQICEITKGMFFTNHYIKDDLEELQQYEREQVDEQPVNPDLFPRFRYISKSQQTVLLIFNIHLINESPYNINPQLKINIKDQFTKYTNRLKDIIGNADYNRLHRNKKSIKEELKKNKNKDEIKKDITLDLNQNKQKSMKSSPIIKAFATIQYESTTPFQSISYTDIPDPPKQYSKLVFSTIPNKSPRLLRSKTTEFSTTTLFSSRKKMVHNTWVQQASKKKINTKSFSTLQTLGHYSTQKIKRMQTIQNESQQQVQPDFFVPDQFVKKKLKLKYEGLISKMRNLNMTIRTQKQETVAQRMQRLQSYIDSRRIVKLNTIKNKHKLLRDRVQY